MQEGRCSAGCTLQEDCFAGGALQCSLHLAVKALCRRGNAVQPAPCRRGSLQHGRSTYPAALHQRSRSCTYPEVAPTINCTQRRCCTQELHLASTCNVQRCTWHLVAPTKRLHQLSAAPGGCTAAMNCSYPMQCIALHLARVSLLELHLVSSTQRVLLKQGFHQPRANSKLQ